MPKWTQGCLIGAVLIVIILGGAMAGVGAMLAGATRTQPKAEDRPPPLVRVMDLIPDSVTFSVESQGSVLPVTQTSLSAEVAGTVVELSSAFAPGDSFQAGQQLMRIDPTNYEVAVARSKAALDQRQIEYDGAKKLREQGYRAEVSCPTTVWCELVTRSGVTMSHRARRLAPCLPPIVSKSDCHYPITILRL